MMTQLSNIQMLTAIKAVVKLSQKCSQLLTQISDFLCLHANSPLSAVFCRTYRLGLFKFLSPCGAVMLDRCLHRGRNRSVYAFNGSNPNIRKLLQPLKPVLLKNEQADLPANHLDNLSTTVFLYSVRLPPAF